MESIFGFINVLPGAFSAYRWVAIRGDPLTHYFVVEETPIEELDPFTANMYLAEDRVSWSTQRVTCGRGACPVLHARAIA